MNANEEMEMETIEENLPEGEEGEQEIIEEALSGGWKPKDQYTGDPKKWVSAEIFVQRGREITPILRKNNEAMRREIAELKDQIKKSDEGIKSLKDYNAKIEARAYERAMRDLKVQRRQAIAEQDADALANVEEEMEELEKIKPEPEVEAKKPDTPAEDPVFVEWRDENKSWFNDKNQDLLDAAHGIGMRLRSENGDKLVGRAFLDKLKKILTERYPDRFGAARKKPGMVEGDTGSGGEGRKTGSLSDLPSDARRECAALIKEDWYIDLAKSKKMTPTEMFVQDYRDNE